MGIGDGGRVHKGVQRDRQGLPERRWPHTWERRKSAILFAFDVCWALDRAPLCRGGSRSSWSTEGLFVSTHHRSFLLAVLLPACLLVGAFAVVQAQNAGSASRWSDP